MKHTRPLLSSLGAIFMVDGVTNTLAYESKNQLISIQSRTVDAHYLYDGDGRRVLTVVDDARKVYIGDYFEAELGDGSSPTSLPALQNYPASLGPTYPARVFLPGMMIPQPAQTNSGNHGTPLYRTHPVDPPEGVTWRSYYSAGGARVAEREITHPMGGPVSQQVFYLIADHLGSTTVVTNQNGVEAGRNMYTAWGESRGTSGTIPTRRLYTGQLEAEAGLYYYGARFYDPYLNCWTQPDTIVPNSINPLAYDRYAYGFNNPLRYNDPSGHFPFDEILDAIFIAYDVGDILINGPTPMNEAALAADLVFAAIPYGTGGGLAVRAGGEAAIQGVLRLPAGVRALQFAEKLAQFATGSGTDTNGLNLPGETSSSSTSNLIPGTKENVPGIDPGKVFLPEEKVNQAAKRGWSFDDILDAVSNPAQTRSNSNIVNRANNNPVTYYYRADGYYVVVDNITGQVVQISNRNDVNWIDEMTNSIVQPIK